MAYYPLPLLCSFMGSHQMTDIVQTLKSTAAAISSDTLSRWVMLVADREIERLEVLCKYKDEVIEQRNAEFSRNFKEIEKLKALLGGTQ